MVRDLSLGDIPVEEATVLQLAEITKVMSDYEGTDATPFVREALLNKGTHCFYSKEFSTAILCLPLDNGRYDVHLYGKGRGGRGLRNWCLRITLFMFKEYDAKVLLNWVKCNRRDLRFFMVALGTKKIATVRDEILYCATCEESAQIKKRIR